MKSWLTLMLIAGCTGGSGTRGQCGEGGAIQSSCPEADGTAEGACWKLVDCGAIVVSIDDDTKIDWGTCVDTIESATTTAQQLMIACIDGSTCDGLKTETGPDNVRTDDIACFRFGDR